MAMTKDCNSGYGKGQYFSEQGDCRGRLKKLNMKVIYGRIKKLNTKVIYGKGIIGRLEEWFL